MRRKLKQEHKSWQIYKKWQKEHVNEIREGQLITSLREFQMIYNDPDIGRRIKKIQDEVRYQMSYKTFNALKKSYLMFNDEPLDSSQFNRAMSTKELAKYIQDEIEEYRLKLKEQNPNMSKKDIALAVSNYFFGS